MVYYMWLTEDGEAWIVGTRIEGDFETALKAIKAAGIPDPIKSGNPPTGWCPGRKSDKK